MLNDSELYELISYANKANEIVKDELTESEDYIFKRNACENILEHVMYGIS